VPDKKSPIKVIQGKLWHHEFEIVPGVRTHGSYDPACVWKELCLPQDMRGISVADVGASNGYFSFEARKRGARVVAFDFQHKDNSGFGLAQYICGMDDIEHYQENVLSITPKKYGQFDIVPALGTTSRTRIAPWLTGRRYRDRACWSNPTASIRRSAAGGLRAPHPVHFRSGAISGAGSAKQRPEQLWGIHLSLPVADDRGYWPLCVEKPDLGDRLLLNASRSDVVASKTRLRLAYGLLAPVFHGENRHDPTAWQMF
jgi:hypothetical protein